VHSNWFLVLLADGQTWWQQAVWVATREVGSEVEHVDSQAFLDHLRHELLPTYADAVAAAVEELATQPLGRTWKSERTRWQGLSPAANSDPTAAVTTTTAAVVVVGHMCAGTWNWQRAMAVYTPVGQHLVVSPKRQLAIPGWDSQTLEQRDVFVHTSQETPVQMIC
jgi:hypothetical protein